MDWDTFGWVVAAFLAGRFIRISTKLNEKGKEEEDPKGY